MKKYKLYDTVCFEYNGKKYYGQIINEIGIDKYKEYKIVSWIGKDWFSAWVKASQILNDRRETKRRHKKDRRKGLTDNDE